MAEEDDGVPESTYGNCGACGCRGELGTSFRGGEFLHKLTQNDEGETCIYCGYGSYLDGYLLYPDAGQQAAVKAAGEPLCFECLKKALGASVQACCYFEEGSKREEMAL